MGQTHQEDARRPDGAAHESWQKAPGLVEHALLSLRRSVADGKYGLHDDSSEAAGIVDQINEDAFMVCLRADAEDVCVSSKLS
jgi:hypothetical protein